MSYRDDITAPFRWVHDLWIRWLRTPAKARIDRSRMYNWLHVGLAAAGSGVMIHPFGTGALQYLTRDDNWRLGLCMAAGSGVCLLGSLMGTRFWFPSAITDVRLPYWFAVCGQVSVVGSLAIYLAVITFHSDVIGNTSGFLMFTITAGCLHTAVVGTKEIHRVNRLDRIVHRGGVVRRKERYGLVVDVAEVGEVP